MTDLSPEKLAEIRARAEAATPGPWYYRPREHDDWGQIRTAPGDDGFAALIACARSGGYPTEDELDQHRHNGTDPYGPNALFIVHAREDVPALLAEVERLKEMKFKFSDKLAQETIDEQVRTIDRLTEKFQTAKAEVEQLRGERAGLDPTVEDSERIRRCLSFLGHSTGSESIETIGFEFLSHVRTIMRSIEARIDAPDEGDREETTDRNPRSWAAWKRRAEAAESLLTASRDGDLTLGDLRAAARALASPSPGNDEKETNDGK